MTAWETFAHPDVGVTFEYPAVTPGGERVERVEQRLDDERGDRHCVHLTSPRSRELYVEVVRFRDLAPPDEYARHRPYLEQRFGAGAVTALTETTLAGRPAWAYGFGWEEGERSVLLLEIGGDTYRVIYDPRSELNARVLETLSVAG